MRQIAAIANCLCCNSYFLVFVKEYAPQAYSGGKGKDDLLDLFAKVSEHLAASGYPFLPCPTCQQLTTGLSYREVEQSSEPLTLVPGRYVKFAEDETDVPLYAGEMGGGAKFQLVHGLGPPGLNLDKRGHRIYQKSLKEYFKIEEYNPEECGNKTTAEHTYIIATVFQALQCTKDPNALLTELFELKPLFAHWGEVAERLESSIVSTDFKALQITDRPPPPEEEEEDSSDRRGGGRGGGKRGGGHSKAGRDAKDSKGGGGGGGGSAAAGSGKAPMDASTGSSGGNAGASGKRGADEKDDRRSKEARSRAFWEAEVDDWRDLLQGTGRQQSQQQPQQPVSEDLMSDNSAGPAAASAGAAKPRATAGGGSMDTSNDAKKQPAAP